MGNSYENLVVKNHKSDTAAELADAPTDVLYGVSEGDAEKLSDAFGIDTIRELAQSPHFRAAVAITSAADGLPGFDPGPPQPWVSLFATAPLSTYTDRPDLFRIDFGPVFYRGRLDGTARVLLVGQDPSVNEVLAHRAFVGVSGQRLQGFLRKLGITRSYLMLNTFSYSIFGQFGGENKTLSHQDPILGFRNGQFDKAASDNPLRAVVTVGTGAREAVDRWPGAGNLPRVHITHPASPNVGQLLQSWNEGLALLREIVEPDDGGSPGPDYGGAFLASDIVPVPSEDLPFGIPSWHGHGDHATRSGNEVIEWHSQAL